MSTHDFKETFMQGTVISILGKYFKYLREYY